MSSLDIVGHVAYVFLFVGMLFIASDHPAGWWGWIFRFVGETAWMVIGIYLGMTSIVIWGLVFMAADINGVVKSRRRRGLMKNGRASR